MQIIKTHYTLILIGVLFFIIILQRACYNDTLQQSKPKIEIRYDTVYKHVHDTIKKVVRHVVHDTVIPDKLDYALSNNIDTCNARFDKLLKQHVSRKIYQDTLKLDSIGKIVIIDTVWLNKLGKRTKIFNYKIPTITKTITITKEKEPVRQLYIGGNIFADKNSLQLLTPGLLYKNKKDQIYQANLGVDFNGVFTYGVGAYWKISFKNKKQ
jgi:hypothetical protein